MLEKVISGGQTGADKTGLITARLFKIHTGGTAPKGWRICNYDGSDGTDPTLADFGLVEHTSRNYRPRTEQNVVDSDATVVFGFTGSPGVKLTINKAKEHGKVLIVNPAPQMLVDMIALHDIKTLNVAGNRYSSFNPSIISETFDCLSKAFYLMGFEAIRANFYEYGEDIKDGAIAFLSWSATVERGGMCDRPL